MRGAIFLLQKGGKMTYRRKINLLFILVGILLVLAVCMLPALFDSLHAQSLPQGPAVVKLQVSGRNDDSNLLSERLQGWLGPRAAVDVSPDASVDATVVLDFLRFDSSYKPQQRSIIREGGADGASRGIGDLGQATAGELERNGGIAGRAIGAAIRTGSNTASQKTQQKILYGAPKYESVQLQYKYCLGDNCKPLSATLYAQVERQTDSTGQWSKFKVLEVGHDPQNLQPLEPVMDLGEGYSALFPARMQEGLFALMMHTNPRTQEDEPRWPLVRGDEMFVRLRQLVETKAVAKTTRERAVTTVAPPTTRPTKPPKYNAPERVGPNTATGRKP